MSLLIELSAFLFALVILSNVWKLAMHGLRHLRFRMSQSQDDPYEERFRQLAAQAFEGPLLLTDDRDKIKETPKPEPNRRPTLAPVSCHLSDPFERTFS